MAKSDKKKAAEDRLEALQVNLVDAQIWAQSAGKRICIVFEGRDAAGKDGAIKRITEHLAVRQTQVVALPKPSDREKTQWWFQRYIPHLPAAGEWTLFNRSWYNRAGVEKVMGFSTVEEQARFIKDVPQFESMLIHDDIILIKLWLDISQDEQKKRLDDRRSDPLKRLKVSPLDAVAQAKWTDYSAARDEMLKASHTKQAPWTCVKTDDKTAARENIIRHILSTIDECQYTNPVPKPDGDIVFSFDAVTKGKRSLNP
ncbi:polyphosphate kinase 2 [Asticcacaulis sp. ZE23SCel15]|uniref:polyphosphate kinase 2 n=1 Tax=Asticcacaulis sp. ZE23SCel15 TaxID=3059027 RepID=UPI00265E1552|nr:polyphosphate kinase 2 [Asticcacaulis sp. ZE23SCel15]WKL56985.1 polyphosphate kinase 2 [Asticcacaulis sp. ZE23SCel15]